MNSALQCLSHSMPLVSYFCKHLLFKEDLNSSNKLASKNNEIAILFAKFLHTMWNEEENGQKSFNPILLKRAIGIKNDMFKGNQQHDSNELLQFLLDQIHEDLNRVKDKPKLL
jgi:ubiquitin C-terminal hydrolase